MALEHVFTTVSFSVTEKSELNRNLIGIATFRGSWGAVMAALWAMSGTVIILAQILCSQKLCSESLPGWPGRARFRQFFWLNYLNFLVHPNPHRYLLLYQSFPHSLHSKRIKCSFSSSRSAFSQALLYF